MSASQSHPDQRSPRPRRTGRQTVGEVIAAFERAAEQGVVHDEAGEPYGPSELRDLRAALSHVDSELGSADVRSVRNRDVKALLEELRDEGLSERRQTAVAGALASLYAYALQQGLVAVNPVIGGLPPPRREDPAGAHRPRRQAPPSRRAPAPTPTLAMVALGARVAFWTTVVIVVAFAVVVLALVVELV